MYDLSARLDERSAVHPGSSLLITSPQGDLTTACVLDILGDGLEAGDGAVLVTTENTPETLAESLGNRTAYDSHQVAIIDCTGSESREPDELESGEFVYRVRGPGDLTGIGIGLTESFERLDTGGIERSRVALLSLSALLAVREESAVFKFCHVLTSRLATAGFLGLFAMETGDADEFEFQIISEAFDEIVTVSP